MKVLYLSVNLLASLIVLADLLMRYESFVGTGPLSIKSHKPPPLAEPYRISLKLPYFPANNIDIMAMLFLRSHFNEIIPDTFEPDNMHGLL